jgi:hypothetical protein
MELGSAPAEMAHHLGAAAFSISRLIDRKLKGADRTKCSSRIGALMLFVSKWGADPYSPLKTSLTELH